MADEKKATMRNTEVEAIKPFLRAGKPVEIGDKFKVTENQAKILSDLGLIK